MDNFIIEDLGKTCLMFWGLIGLLVIWYRHKIKEFNRLKQEIEKVEEEAEPEPEIIPLQSVPESEASDFQNVTYLTIPRQSKH